MHAVRVLEHHAANTVRIFWVLNSIENHLGHSPLAIFRLATCFMIDRLGQANLFLRSDRKFFIGRLEFGLGVFCQQLRSERVDRLL